MKKRLFFLAILSLFLQIGVSFYETYADLKIYHIPWANNIAEFGLSGFYDRMFSLNNGAVYPPIAVYFFIVCRWLSELLIQPTLDFIWFLNTSLKIWPSQITLFITSKNLEYTIYKLPGIMANILLAFSVYFLVKELLVSKKKSNSSFVAFVSILFNPALIFLSAMWGQIDVIPLMFFVWAFYFLARNKLIYSVIFLCFGLLTKQTVLLILPFYVLALLIKIRYKWHVLLPLFLIAYIVFVLAFWFFQTNLLMKLLPFVSYINIALGFGSEMLSFHAHNFWYLVSNPYSKDTNLLFGFVSLRVLSILVVGLLFGLTMIKSLGPKKNLINIIVNLSIFSLLATFFLTRMHERHLVIALPFILIWIVFYSRFYWLYVFESIYLWLNLYAAWPVPSSLFLANLFNNKIFVKVLVVIQLFVFVQIIKIWLFGFDKKKALDFIDKLAFGKKQN